MHWMRLTEKTSEHEETAIVTIQKKYWEKTDWREKERKRERERERERERRKEKTHQ